MPEWLSSRLPGWCTEWHFVAFAVAFSVTSAAISLLVVSYVLARLPADYFVNPAARERQARRHPVAHVLLTVGRNALGYFLIALGAILSLPGVPGQGILTILMGVLLIDFPRKIEGERWLVSRRAVLLAVNKLRARFNRPPLIVSTEDMQAPAGTGSCGPAG